MPARGILLFKLVFLFNSQVHITIKGSRDILPKTPLKKSRGSSKFTFLRNTKETFYIKGPKLGNLEIVTIEVRLINLWKYEENMQK